MGFPVTTGPTTADALTTGTTVTLTMPQSKFKIVNNDTANSIKITLGTWTDIYVHAGQTKECFAQYSDFVVYGLGDTVSVTYTCTEDGTDVISRSELAAEKVKGLVALTDAAATLTAAQLVAASIFTQTPTAGRTLTTATGAQIIAALPNYSVGTCIEFTIVNIAADTHVITLAAGASGVTLTGLATVAAATSGTFVLRIASSTAVVIYRK